MTLSQIEILIQENRRKQKKALKPHRSLDKQCFIKKPLIKYETFEKNRTIK